MVFDSCNTGLFCTYQEVYKHDLPRVSAILIRVSLGRSKVTSYPYYMSGRARQQYVAVRRRIRLQKRAIAAAAAPLVLGLYEHSTRKKQHSTRKMIRWRLCERGKHAHMYCTVYQSVRKPFFSPQTAMVHSLLLALARTLKIEA